MISKTLLNQQKEENGRRNCVMINLHESIGQVSNLRSLDLHLDSFYDCATQPGENLNTVKS